MTFSKHLTEIFFPPEILENRFCKVYIYLLFTNDLEELKRTYKYFYFFVTIILVTEMFFSLQILVPLHSLCNPISYFYLSLTLSFLLSLSLSLSLSLLPFLPHSLSHFFLWIFFAWTKPQVNLFL